MFSHFGRNLLSLPPPVNTLLNLHTLVYINNFYVIKLKQTKKKCLLKKTLCTCIYISSEVRVLGDAYVQNIFLPMCITV